MEANVTPAGWYPDPKDTARFRYWDGARWSALTQPPVISPTRGNAAVGSPGNPIGAGSVGLAAALASMTATALDEPRPAPVAVVERPARRRHLWRPRPAG